MAGESFIKKFTITFSDNYPALYSFKDSLPCNVEAAIGPIHYTESGERLECKSAKLSIRTYFKLEDDIGSMEDICNKAATELAQHYANYDGTLYLWQLMPTGPVIDPDTFGPCCMWLIRYATEI